jgi:hypothetical protein
MLMMRRGYHQWQYEYIHTVFHANSQCVSVKRVFCGWIGLQRDRPGSLVMMQEHIHLNIKISYYALLYVNMPFLKQRTLSQFAHSNYYCRWSLTSSVVAKPERSALVVTNPTITYQPETTPSSDPS